MEKDGDKSSDTWLDLSDEESCNWMMFVRPAQNHLEQNLVAYQYGSEIFYTCIKHIQPKQELKVSPGRVLRSRSSRPRTKKSCSKLWREILLAPSSGVEGKKLLMVQFKCWSNAGFVLKFSVCAAVGGAYHGSTLQFVFAYKRSSSITKTGCL